MRLIRAEFARFAGGLIADALRRTSASYPAC